MEGRGKQNEPKQVEVTHLGHKDDTMATDDATMMREGPDDATASSGLQYVFFFFLIHCLLN